MDTWLLIVAILLFTFRRPLVRNWRMIVPILLSFVGGMVFVGLVLGNGVSGLSPVLTLLLCVVAAVWIYRIFQGLFR